LTADPSLIAQARLRVLGWQRTGSVHPRYVESWRQLLELPAAALVAALAERSERMHDLRQVSPFAGVLDARTRWRIHREVGARAP
jgi:hypothetical protein